MHEQPDIHARLMAVYPQVPQWWYIIIFLSMFVFGVISIEVWDTKFPVQYFILALVIAFVYIIPIGMIQAITNQQVGLNVITELIIGYALPGRPIAMMMFKTWGYITMAQALTFTSDFKLGHYMKIPRARCSSCQIVANRHRGHDAARRARRGCSPTSPTCAIARYRRRSGARPRRYSAPRPSSGASLGPPGSSRTVQIYYGLVFFFLVGFLCPVFAWLATRKWPNSWLRYLNFPVIFSGTGSIPPANSNNYVPWAIVGFIFQYVIRRRHFAWWTKYNYVLSAALDSGVAVTAVLIFFCLQYPRDGAIGKDTIQYLVGQHRVL
ncbi:OPT oligopeptide transporter protein-domain-containing protein [Mycena rebaudengoi]|nr:OPT oligopeptide transporter protein-domain-containing protein [Mycena rebaudengoi]